MPEAFEKAVALRDGTTARLRFVRPDDKDTLAEEFSRLSEDSRRNRFFIALSDLSPAMLRYFTEVDGQNHVAIVAECDSLDLKVDRGMGIARFVKLKEDPTIAEPAVTVADWAQGRGLGKVLLHELVGLARERGVKTFRSFVLASNAPMIHMLEGLSAKVAAREDGPEDDAVLTLDLPLDAIAVEGAAGEETLLWKVFRAVAKAWAAFRRAGKGEGGGGERGGKSG